MMESQVDRELLEKIADLIGKPVGAFNIRKDTGCDGRQSTENIQITGKTDGKSGIDIRIKDGTKGEQCHIPVIITKPGIQELVKTAMWTSWPAAASTTAAERTAVMTVSTPSM